MLPAQRRLRTWWRETDARRGGPARPGPINGGGLGIPSSRCRRGSILRQAAGQVPRWIARAPTSMRCAPQRPRVCCAARVTPSPDGWLVRLAVGRAGGPVCSTAPPWLQPCRARPRLLLLLRGLPVPGRQREQRAAPAPLTGSGSARTGSQGHYSRLRRAARSPASYVPGSGCHNSRWPGTRWCGMNRGM